MEIEILEDRKNDLLSRREIKFRIATDGATPSRKEVRKKLLALLDTKDDLLVLDRMETMFGKREVLGYAKIYESPEKVKEIELEHIIERNIRDMEEGEVSEGEENEQENQENENEEVKEQDESE